MNVEVKGKVRGISSIFKSGDKFKKRDLIVVTDDPSYPQTVAIEFVNDNEEKLDVVEIGQTVSVSCNIRGREWTNPQGEIKYFLSLSGWKIA